MKTILATNNKKVNDYILATHTDLAILDEVKTLEEYKEKATLINPQLLIISEEFFSNFGKEEYDHILQDIHNLLPQIKILFLAQSEPAPNLSEIPGIYILKAPISTSALSKTIYEVTSTTTSNRNATLIAVWSPKAGDGCSFTAIHLAAAMRDIVDREDKVGLLDLNLKTSGLKYQLTFDDAQIIDELLPYVAAGRLTPEIMLECSKEMFRKDSGIWYIGGIAKPELYDQYTALQIHYIIENAKKLFHKTIIDAGSYLDNAGTITALKEADIIYAVIHPTYVSQQILKGMLDLLPMYGINPAKVTVIINRYSPEAVGDSPEIILANLNVSLAGTLPELGHEAISAVNSNRTVLREIGKRTITQYNTTIKSILASLEPTVETKKNLLSRIKNVRGA